MTELGASSYITHLMKAYKLYRCSYRHGSTSRSGSGTYFQNPVVCFSLELPGRRVHKVPAIYSSHSVSEHGLKKHDAIALVSEKSWVCTAPGWEIKLFWNGK